jgi:hypothetical protein
MSSLSQLVGQIESGNNPNASLTDYAGNVSVNAQFQQSAPYIAQYGGVAGEPAIANQAAGLLARNPNATLGDFYSAYNHGSVLPFATYSARFPMQANNFLTNAHAAGYNQNTPLSSLVGGGSAGGPLFNGSSYDSIFGSGSTLPALSDADFKGLTDSDIVGDTADSTASGSGVGGGFGASSFDGNSGLSYASPAFDEGSAGATSLATPSAGAGFDGYSGFGAGNSTNTGGLTAPALDGGAGGSFAAGNPLGYGASGATDASASDTAPFNPGGPLSSTNAAPSLPSGISSTGTGNFYDGTSAPASNATTDTTPASTGDSTTQTQTGNATTGNVPGVTAAPSTGTSTAAAPTGKGSSASGSPVDVTANPDLVTAGNTVAKAASGVGQAITGAEGNAAAAGTSWLGSIFTAGTNLFVRSGFVILGLMVLAGAGLFFYIESQKGGGGMEIVPVPA